MAEDYSPYLIPSFEPPDQYMSYKKSATIESDAKKGDSPELQELLEILNSTTTAYISNFKADTKIPYRLRQGFEQDMDDFSRQLAERIGRTYDRAVGKGLPVRKALDLARSEMNAGLNTLSAKLNRYDAEFSTWFALESLHRDGYTRCLFVSECGANTCERCLAYHGQVFSTLEVPIPPLHPNCGCELLLLDAQAEVMYHLNESAFLQLFYKAKLDNCGGIYLLEHNTFPFSISPDTLKKVTVSNGHAILDSTWPGLQPLPGEYDLAAAADAYFSSLVEDGKDMILYFLNANAERYEHKWDSLGSFMDWLTLGVVSGTWRGIKHRHQMMVDDPSLYNIVNALTLGILDTFKGAVEPEEPFSLQHWLDIVCSCLILYSAYKAAVTVADRLLDSADDALWGTAVDADDVDDMVRNAGLTKAQIDDIINKKAGERPDPSTYLPKEYIDQHLEMFKDGVSKIYAATPEGVVGPVDGTFVFPSSYVDDIIEMSQGDVRILEELLGLESGYLGDAPVRIDVPSPKGLRMPNGNERGATGAWIPGGYTSGGIPEAIVDQLQPGEYTFGPAL